MGRARGFGVDSYNGTPTSAAQRTSTYQSAPLIGQFGFPATTWSSTQAITIASNGTLSLPIVFGLAGVSTGVSVSLLATFPVTVKVVIRGLTLVATSSISVAVGAGLL